MAPLRGHQYDEGGVPWPRSGAMSCERVNGSFTAIYTAVCHLTGECVLMGSSGHNIRVYRVWLRIWIGSFSICRMKCNSLSQFANIFGTYMYCCKHNCNLEIPWCLFPYGSMQRKQRTNTSWVSNQMRIMFVIFSRTNIALGLSPRSILSETYGCYHILIKICAEKNNWWFVIFSSLKMFPFLKDA